MPERMPRPEGIATLPVRPAHRHQHLGRNECPDQRGLRQLTVDLCLDLAMPGEMPRSEGIVFLTTRREPLGDRRIGATP